MSYYFEIIEVTKASMPPAKSPINSIIADQISDGIAKSSPRRICIIGSGITGLTAGLYLSRAGFQVTIVECTLNSGGLVSSFPMGWEKIERIYHHIFTSDEYVLNLADELGIGNEIFWSETEDALYIDNKLYPFSSPMDLVRFKPIPLPDRIRTGMSVLRAAGINSIGDLEKMTAKEWLIAHGGKNAYKKLWEPLLKSKFDNDADKVSAVWIWNKFKLRGGSRKGKTRKQLLGYMNGGFNVLVSAMVKAIEDLGGSVQYGFTALNITEEFQKPDKHKVFNISCVLDDCSSVVIESDSVIATLSGMRFVYMTKELKFTEDFIHRARSIKYKGNLCLVMRLKRSLSKYYWTTVCDSLPFVVVVEHTNLTSLRRYGGHVVYLSRYLDLSDPLWTQSDSDIYKLFCKGLVEMYPDFHVGDVKDWRLTRTRYAQPVVETDYPDIMPPISTPNSGMVLAGMAQIYPEDRGINYAIRLGVDAANAVTTYFDGKPN